MKCGVECAAHWIHLSDGTPVTKQGEPLATRFAHSGPDAFITEATGNVTLPLDLLLADFERARER